MSVFKLVFGMMSGMSDAKRFHLMNLALGGVVAVMLCFDRRTAVQLMALTGTAWLAMLLIVPRLFYSGRFGRWHTELERIAKLSKYVGLWVAAWFTLHATTAVVTHYGVPQNILDFVLRFELSQPIVLGLASLLILWLIAMLSNKWSYAHVKWWKQLNMLVWLIPFMGLTHALLASGTFLGEGPALYIAPVLLGIAGLLGYDSLFSRQRRFTDKLRLIYLTLGVFVALLVVLAWPR